MKKSNINHNKVHKRKHLKNEKSVREERENQQYHISKYAWRSLKTKTIYYNLGKTPSNPRSCQQDNELYEKSCCLNISEAGYQLWSYGLK